MAYLKKKDGKGKEPTKKRRRQREDRDNDLRKRRVSFLDRNTITYFDYKDIDILKKFLTKKGRIKSRKRTGVTTKQQRRVAQAVKHARFMALLPYTDQHA